MTVLCSYFRKK